MKTSKHLFASILLLFFSSFQLLFAQVVTEALQTYYDLNGNTEDQSGNNLHGNGLDLATTIGIENVSNTAYSFNGSTSNIDCGNEGRNITDQLTISSWIKTTSLERQFFVSKYNSDEDIGYFLATENGNAIVKIKSSYFGLQQETKSSVMNQLSKSQQKDWLHKNLEILYF